MYSSDKRIVLTLDAGGTNFVFTAIQANQEITKSIILPADTTDLEKCLATVVDGFIQLKSQLQVQPAAISFAFPGPADYLNGIIGDLPNFPAFRGGIALGPFLKKKFGIPVFINNDGHLFAYGEALAGKLSEVNIMLEKSGSSKRYRNLLGVTLGTGFGGGVVIDNTLLIGDNGCGGSVWLSANKYNNDLIAEENVSIRAVSRVYNELTGEKRHLTPKDIFDIAEKNKPGNHEAAKVSFEKLGRATGFTIAESLNIVDGIVVIGGGISKAYKYILPALVDEMNGNRFMVDNTSFPRLQMKAYNLKDQAHLAEFLSETSKLVSISGTSEFAKYNMEKKICVDVTSIGTSKAVSLGAYNFALNQLDNQF